MSASKVNGVGPKSFSRLEALGIHTIGELAGHDESWLISHFGNNYGKWLFRTSRGLDDRPVVTHSEPVSMSRETTFERDLHAVADKAKLGEIFTRLCTQLAADLLRKNYHARKISIKLRFDDFSTVTRDMALPAAISTSAEIRNAAGQCLKRVDLGRRIRLIGVKAGSLLRPGTETSSNQLQLPFSPPFADTE